MSSISSLTTVLCLSGHDPSGGAGIQADSEAITAQGCHAATVITCLTLQDTRNVRELIPLSADFVMRQARLMCEDFHIGAIKIGLLGSSSMANAVTELLRELQGNGIHVPVVLDPVLAAGGGINLAPQNIIPDLLNILPLVTLLTPNRQEARRLGNTDSVSTAAQRFIATGCKAVLITGADESEAQVVTNQLYLPHDTHQWQYPKLDGQYHGSGCTLASSIAARLALGEPLQQALGTAQDYTLQTLRRATRPGRGQAIPNRAKICKH